ncbi:MAG: prenyltransferase [Candidatus Latescibacteria bacterium]|nr:prenyltransferase [Candidatus Latescibacterota bacterium]
MSNVPYVLGPMRLPFLILAPACVLVGLGTAVQVSKGVETLSFVLALVGAIAAHISVNAFNEYFDFKSGLDFRTRRTPFSGGSGVLPERPEFAGRALLTAWVTFVLTALVGLYFIWLWGWEILPLGLLGLFVVLAYTSWLAYNPFLFLIAPGLGFGTFMVMGTHFALTGEYGWTAFVGSLVPFFLVSNLLLLNQFPDVDADRTVGRRHLPIVIGRRASSLIYGAFLLLAYLSIGVGVWLGMFPRFGLLGLATVPLAILAYRGARRHAEDPEKLTPALTMNVLINILTPALLGVGLMLG